MENISTVQGEFVKPGCIKSQNTAQTFKNAIERTRRLRVNKSKQAPGSTEAHMGDHSPELDERPAQRPTCPTNFSPLKQNEHGPRPFWDDDDKDECDGLTLEEAMARRLQSLLKGSSIGFSRSKDA